MECGYIPHIPFFSAHFAIRLLFNSDKFHDLEFDYCRSLWNLMEQQQIGSIDVVFRSANMLPTVEEIHFLKFRI